jgi:type III secretion protein W
MLEELTIEQLAASTIAEEFAETGATNYLQRIKTGEKLEEKVKKGRVNKASETDEDDNDTPEAIDAVARVEELASRFQRRNEELNAQSLELLWQRIQSAETEQEVLEIVQEFYPDPNLADAALEFLISAEPVGPRKELLVRAQEQLRTRYAKEIQTGKNIQSVSREYAAKGLESPSSLRALYRNVLDVPREPVVLFEELSSKYNYSQLNDVIFFLLHSLNDDMKSLAPTLEPRELLHLMKQCRVLNGILGVYRFFIQSQKMLAQQFQRARFPIPDELNFEVLAKVFTRLVADRFPNPMKVIQTAPQLFVQNSPGAQVLIYELFRKATENVALRLFPNENPENLQKALDEARTQIEQQIDAVQREQIKKILVAEAKQKALKRGPQKAKES